MDLDDPAQRARFFELHSGLEREGPGDTASTRRALRLAGLDGDRATLPLEVLDLGCGPGAPTLDLAAALPRSRITAVDLHAPYLEALRRRAQAAGIADRIATLVADMGDLPVARGSVDLIWSEGAAYFLGLPAALERWGGLLRPGGVVALTEPCWTVDDVKDDVPDDVRRIWETEYPPMTDRAGCLAQVAAAGWRVLGDFVLPEAAWAAYYEPLAERVDALAARREASDTAGAAVLEAAREEIEDRRRHGHHYGYLFLVLTPA